MSKQDTHFFNTFSVVIGLLVVIAIVLFALARIIGKRTQLVQVQADPAYVAQVRENIRPIARIAVAGADNSALAIAPPAPLPAPAAGGTSAEAGATEGTGAAAAVASSAPKDGAALYASTCNVCHGAGLAGAPKTGDKVAWAPRIAQGKATLYEHSIKGFTGKSGVMLPKGGRTDLSDELVQQAVDYMVAQSQ